MKGADTDTSDEETYNDCNPLPLNAIRFYESVEEKAI